MYIVMEIQKAEERLSTIVTQHETLQDAKAKYFQVLSAAVNSPLERHFVTILTEKGSSLLNDGFDHKEIGEV